MSELGGALCATAAVLLLGSGPGCGQAVQLHRCSPPSPQPDMAALADAAAPIVRALQRGGRVTYFGPLGENSCELIAYLEGVPGTSPIKAGCNPATWWVQWASEAGRECVVGSSMVL